MAHTKPASNTASLYLRLSSVTDDAQTGLTTQEADLRALADRRGLRVVAVHVDESKSGALRNRPGMLAWLGDAESGRADHLLAWRLDRVSRGGPAGLARFLDVVAGLDADGNPTGPGVRFLSAADSLDSHAPGWALQAAVLGAVAQGEREAVSSRMRAHRAEGRRTGRVVGGRRSWPFTTEPRDDGAGLRFVPIPERAAAIRDAYDALRVGASITSVSAALDRSTSSTRRLLQSPRLYGATPDGADVVRNPDGTARIDPGQAILTLAEWTELQTLLAGRSTRRNDPSTEPALLTGILHCASCGRTMYPHRPSGRTAVYRCRGGRSCSQPVSVRMSDAEELMVALFRSRIGDQRPAVTARPTRTDPDELAALEEALTAVEQRLTDDLDDAEAVAAIRTRRDLRERLRAAQDAAVVYEPVTDTRTYAEQFDDPAATVEQRRALVDLAADHVSVAPGTRGTFDPARFTFATETDYDA